MNSPSFAASLLVGILALGAIAVSPIASQDTETKKPVTVILTRHAEKAATSDKPGDPLLTEAGEARARALARLVGHADVTHLFSSEYRRTRDTLAPLAKLLELEVEVISAREPERQREALLALPPGSVAVVSGHSNTIPALIQKLGGEVKDLEDHPQYGQILLDDAYDRLFVLTLPVGKLAAPQTLELRYGK